MRTPSIAVVLAALPLAAHAFQTQEASEPRPTLSHYNLEKSGLALDGYDPVAYFPDGGGEPAEGKASLSTTFRGVTYRFASEKNRKAFLATPARFEPAYGGWCAFAMREGDKVEIDPDYFVIQNGRLLVFYKSLFANTKKKWLKGDPAAFEASADGHWTRLSGEGTARDLRHFNLEGQLALAGFDPVAYFPAGGAEPKKGAEKVSLVHRNVRYRFASEENAASFEKTPDAFEPRYGGYCAWAMARGKKVAVDPSAFVVDDSGLFLFYDAGKRDEWKQGGSAMKKDADREWARLHEK